MPPSQNSSSSPSSSGHSQSLPRRVCIPFQSYLSSPQSHSHLPSRRCCNSILCSFALCYLLLCSSGDPDSRLPGRRTSKWQPTSILSHFISYTQEKPIMYRRYVTLHTGACIAVFSIAAVWLIISASRHSTAQSNCESTFFPASGSNGGTSSEGQTLCDIFTWVDVGLMAGAWVFFALVQVSDDLITIAIRTFTTSSRRISSSSCHHMARLSERITRSMMHSMIQPDH